MQFSDLAQNLDAKVVGTDVEFASLSTDSRSVHPGEVFLALKGERFDGHEHVQAAADAGACGAVVSERVSAGIPQLLVDDTHVALGQIARMNRLRSEARVVALTGSQGKTTVKEMIAAILSSRAPTLATHANLNNTIGVPLTLLRLSAEHEFAVIEMGANRGGEIDFSAGIAAPDVALITTASAAHVEGFGSLAGIVKAKGEILDHIKPGGTAVLNYDDSHVSDWIERVTPERYVQFSLQEGARAEYIARDIQRNPNGRVAFTLLTPVGECEIDMKLLGRHNVMNATAAAAVALEVGADLENVKAGLAGLEALPGRLNVVTGIANSLLLDDSYNASPNSFSAGIDVLATFPGRRILISGDMKELGDETEYAHKLVGNLAQQAGIDALWSVGEHAGLVVSNFGNNAKAFADQESLIAYARNQLDASTVVLIKGSRGAGMDRVVSELQAKEEL
jgi:UDP-N-acetylmuramoyl-tripeptide--D-alanyl-D-alanine ligase